MILFPFSKGHLCLCYSPKVEPGGWDIIPAPHSHSGSMVLQPLITKPLSLKPSCCYYFPYSVHLLTFRRLSFYNFNTWIELYLQSTPYHCYLPSVSLPTPWPSCSTPAETPWSLSKLFFQDSKFWNLPLSPQCPPPHSRSCHTSVESVALSTTWLLGSNPFVLSLGMRNPLFP